MIEIRKAAVKDSSVLGEIHAKSWKAAYKNIVPDSFLDRFTLEKRQKYFEKALTEEREEDFLVFYDNNPVGLICIGKCRDEDQDARTGEVRGLYILPEYWGKGIGAYALLWGLEELSNRGFEKATLWVLEENIRARNFYEKIGFRYKGYKKDIQIGKNLTELRYEKPL
jgi:ribosomal protein S18 acetylase RimI-like enzyme